ncbi:MAG: magnesium transporter CorA family protein [Thaumarchaeota archaeon]|nr:magnesium transporter CorA family protein [Nitrososphaerota archaeon]
MQTASLRPGVQIFDDVVAFSKAVGEAGYAIDFQSIMQLNTGFLQSAEKYLILNIKDYENDDPNNLLFMTEEKAFLYSKSPPRAEAFNPFEKVCNKPYGRSTVLAYLILNKAVVSYKKRLEVLINGIKEIEQSYDAKKYRELALEFSRLYDRLEDFDDLVLRLEESPLKEVETRYISFDYSVLIAEGRGLLDRCRNRFNMLKDIARDHEIMVTTELNKRIERLNEVVKKLTALTVVLMIPNVIAGHFGMNFRSMPELEIPWAYPAVIIFQIIISTLAIIVFRKIKWL